MGSDRILVYGAAGHTGRFVVAELLRRGLSPIVAGREAARLESLKGEFPALHLRVASIEESRSLDDAFAGAGVVINCAGPFVDTSAPMIEAAIRNRVHYLDIAAEQAAVFTAFQRFSEAARKAAIVVAPAMGFYGGLTDLLVTAAMRDWTHIYECEVAVALDSWHPTRGTRLTGERNTGQRRFFVQGKLEHRDPLPAREWQFPQPFGPQEVASLALAESILIPRHLQLSDVRFYLNTLSIAELSNPNTPPPVPHDASGRSAQTFLVDARVRKEHETRRAIARGQDIYAVTAPIVVEAATRILKGQCSKFGVRAAGELFAERDFLRSLESDSLTVEFEPQD